MFNKMYPNRLLCEVLEEMRMGIKTLNFAYLPALIEEVQSMGNRMEAALSDQNDIEEMKKEREELHKEVADLKEEVEKLKKKKEKK